MNREIVFVDANVNDYQTLIEGLDPEAEFFLIDELSDGLDQIVARLQGRTDISALHIISHGSQGALYLGNTVLDSGNLDAYQAQLSAIGSSLTETGDILLYGCNVAQGKEGIRFIQSLAGATGADVAGSSDLTGTPSSSGNWSLEASVGTIETRTVDFPAEITPSLPATVETHIVWNGTTYIVPLASEIRMDTVGSLFYVKDVNGQLLTTMVVEKKAALAAASMALDYFKDISPAPLINSIDSVSAAIDDLIFNLRGLFGASQAMDWVSNIAGFVVDAIPGPKSLYTAVVTLDPNAIVPDFAQLVLGAEESVIEWETLKAQSFALFEAKGALNKAKLDLIEVFNQTSAKGDLSSAQLDINWIIDSYYKTYLGLMTSVRGIEGVKQFAQSIASDNSVVDALVDGGLAIGNVLLSHDVVDNKYGSYVQLAAATYSYYDALSDKTHTAAAIQQLDKAFSIDDSTALFNEKVLTKIESSIAANDSAYQTTVNGTLTPVMLLSENLSTRFVKNSGTSTVHEFGITLTSDKQMDLVFDHFSGPVKGVVDIYKDGVWVGGTDSSGGANSMSILNFQGVGDYTVRLTQTGAIASDYQVKLNLEPRVPRISIRDDSVQDTVPGSISTTATMNPNGGSVQGAIENVADQDWYKVTLSKDKIYTIDLNGVDDFGNYPELENQIIWIRNSAGRELEGAEGSPNGYDAKFDFQPATDGTYFISVGKDNQTNGYQLVKGKMAWLKGYGGYEISIDSRTAPVEAPDEFGDDRASAHVLNTASSPIAGTIQISGGIQKASDDDFFKVYLDAGKTYLAAAYGKDSAMGSLENPDLHWDVSEQTTYLGINAHDEGELFTPTQSGYYYINVDSEGTEPRKGSYVLQVTGYDLSVDLLDNILTSGVVPANGTPSAPSAINQTGDKDWFKANLNPQSDVAGWSTGKYVTYHTYVDEVDSGNSLQARYFFSVDGAALTVSGANRGSYTTANPATAFLQVNEDGGFPGGYTVELNPYLDDAGTSVDTSRMLTVSSAASPQYLTGTLEKSYDEDWFRVQLNAGTSYRIDAKGAPSGNGSAHDLEVSILDAENYSGSLTFRDGGASNANGDDVSAIFVPSHSGYYIIEVANDGAAQEGTYKVAVVDTTGTDDVADIAHARTLTAGTPLTGFFERAGDTDWFKATLTAGKQYRFSSTEIENEYLREAIMQIVDANGNPVAGIEDNYFGDYSLNLIPATTGTYYLKLFANPDEATAAEPGIGSYSVSLTETVLTNWTQGQAKNVTYTRTMPDENYSMSLVANHVYEIQVTSSNGYYFDVGYIEIESLTNFGSNSSAKYGSGTSYSTQQIVARTTGTHWVNTDPNAASGSSISVTMNVVDLGVQDDYTDSRNSDVEFFQSQSARALSGTIGYDSSDLEDNDNWYFDAEAGKTYQFSLLNATGSQPMDTALANFRILDAGWNSTLTPGANGQVTFTASSDGRWYANVYDVNNLIETGYTLIGQRSTTSAVNDDFNADALTNGALAPALASDSSISGTFETAGDADWFRVDLSPGQNYFFSSSEGVLTLLRSNYYDSDPYDYYPITPANFDAVQMVQKTDGVQLYANAAATIYVEVKNTGNPADAGTAYTVTAKTKYVPDQAPVADLPPLAVTVEDTIDAWLGLSDVIDADGDDVSVTIQTLPGYASINLGATALTEGSVISGTDLSELTFTPEANFAGNAGVLILDTDDGWGNRVSHTVNLVVFADLTDGDPVATALDYSASINSVSIDLANNTVIEGRDGVRNLDAGIDSVTGSSFEDEIRGSAFADTISGGGGDDYLDGGSGYDELEGGIGDDVLLGGGGGDYLAGGDGNDNVFGGDGSDVIVGGSGHGDDHYDGGTGFDLVSYTSATNPVTVDLTAGVAWGVDIGSDTLASIEGIIGGAGSDTIFGAAFDETLFGETGDDYLAGRGGNDLLSGGAGDDTLDGGAGQDTATYSGSFAGYTVTTDSYGRLSVVDNTPGRDGTDSLSGIETLQFADGPRSAASFLPPMNLTLNLTTAQNDAIRSFFDGLNGSGGLSSADYNALADALDFGTLEEVSLSGTRYEVNVFGVGHVARGSVVYAGTGFQTGGWDGNPLTLTDGVIDISSVITDIEIRNPAAQTMFVLRGGISGIDMVGNETNAGSFNLTELQLGSQEAGNQFLLKGNLTASLTSPNMTVGGDISELSLYVRQGTEAYEFKITGSLTPSASLMEQVNGDITTLSSSLDGEINGLAFTHYTYADGSTQTASSTQSILDASSLHLTGDDLTALVSAATNGLGPDISFSQDGMASNDAGLAANEGAAALALQSDGKVLVGGNVWGTPNVAIMRYQANGELDTSFSGDGKLVSAFGVSYGSIAGIAQDSSGKILVGGSSDGDFTLMRLNGDGSLDTGFASGGISHTTGLGNGSVLALQADGKALLAGGGTIVRYSTTGSLDTAFSADGIATAPIALQATAVAFDASGRILVAGGSNSDFALVRYNADGTLDATFNSGTGYVVTPISPNWDSPSRIALQADGKIIVAGATQSGASVDLAVVRYNADGSLDTTFSGDGIAVVGAGARIGLSGAYDQLKGIVVESSGDITIYGTSGTESVVVTMSSWGGVKSVDTFDTGFYVSGAPVQQSDGAILFAGFNDGDMAVARMLDSQAAIDQILLAGDDTLTLNIDVGADMHGYTGDDTVAGGSGNDRLYGGEGADSLNGGSGMDQLSGNAGSDTMTGGAGKDQFVIDGMTGIDTITDFNPADDTIVLVGSDFTNPTSGAVRFKLTTDTLDADDRVLYNPATGALYYDSDGSGAAAAVQVATLAGAPTITTADVYLNPTNTAIVVADTAAVGENGSVTIDVLANDYLPAGWSLNSFFLTGGTGTLTKNSDGHLVYTPSGYDGLGVGDSATATISYMTMSSNPFGFANSSLTVTINGAAESQTGTAGPDSLIGTAAEDTLLGLAGNDTVVGGNDNDRLTGGTGNDSLDGGGGNDTIDGDAGFDTAHYAGNRADYTIDQGAWYHYTITDNNPDDGSDGIDTVFGIEQLQFGDTSMALQTSGSWDGFKHRPIAPFWANTDWSLVKSHDFNDDGKSDVLLGKPDGSIALWLMDGSTPAAGVIFEPYPGRTLLDAATDYNADGKTDLKWHESDGSSSYWLMDSGWTMAI